MAEKEDGGGAPWLAFLAGIILIAVVAFGVVAYTGGLNQQRETAELEFNMPNVDRPDIDLPAPPPAPTVPPSAEPQAPAQREPQAPSHGLDTAPQPPPDAPGE